jgi:dihydrodipicolinate synthase/N-acetylneuraminate lyase
MPLYCTDGLLVLGSTGEASMLSTAKKQEIIVAVSEYAREKIPDKYKK